MNLVDDYKSYIMIINKLILILFPFFFFCTIKRGVVKRKFSYLTELRLLKVKMIFIDQKTDNKKSYRL